MKSKEIFFTAFIFSGIVCGFIASESHFQTTAYPQKREGSGRGESKTEALDALQFLSACYAFPNKDIPQDAFGKAFDFYKNNFLFQKNPSEAAGSWQNIGPENCGGRTLCVALDPTDTSTVWLGSASGGLWKSTTGGIGTNAWTYVPTGFPVLGVSSIAFKPGSPQTMLIGTGETYSYGTSTNGLVDRTTRGIFGIGILKSTDGGTTWSQVLNWTYQQNRGVWDIKFNPLKPSSVYAATTEGIYKSYDSGNTWAQVCNVQMAMSLVIDPVDTNIIYCGVGNLSSANKGIYKSSNSGSNWTVLASGLPSNAGRTGRITLAINPQNHKTVLAHVCDAFNSIGFYISNNQGVSWLSVSTQDIGMWQGWYASGLLFNKGDTTQVAAGGVYLGLSYDNALNFVQASGNYHSDIHDIIANPLDPNKIYIATDGGLFRSNDFGVTTYECTSGYVTSQFYIGAVSAQDPNMAFAGAQDNYSWQYSGNPTWVSQIGGDGCYTAIDPTNDNNQFGAYQYLNVFKSIDRGINFNQVISNPGGVSGSSAFLAPYLLCPSNPQVMYAGQEQSILKSTDGGDNWMSMVQLDPTNLVLSIGVSSKNTDTLYVGLAPSGSVPMSVFRSSDGGASFTNITGSLPNRYPRRITVDPKNSRIVYAIFSGYGSGHIFKSVNAGNSWTDVSTSLPDMPFHCLAVDPNNTNVIFAGCDLGIFYSIDAGNTWNTFNTGFPEAVMIFDLVVSPSDKTLFAFTHGHGVYKRNLSDALGVLYQEQLSAFMNIYPVPANDLIYFELIPNNSPVARIEIYDLNGRKVIHKEEKLIAGKNNIELPVLSLEPGTYFAKLTAGAKVVSGKFIVLR